MFTEELVDALQVRGLAAADAGAAELEQGLCELAVLDVARCNCFIQWCSRPLAGELVDEVVLVGDLLLAVGPVLGLVELALEGFHYCLKAVSNLFTQARKCGHRASKMGMPCCFRMSMPYNTLLYPGINFISRTDGAVLGWSLISSGLG